MTLALPDYLASLVERLDQSPLTWAFAREPEIVQRDAINGKDIDIWCQYNDVSSVILSLHILGWRIVGGRCIPDLGTRNPNCGSLRFRHRDRCNIPPLELHYGDLRWQFIRYCPASVMASSVKHVEGIPFPSGAALLCILVIRGTLRNRMNSTYGVRAQMVWQSTTSEERKVWQSLARKTLGQKTTNSIVHTLDQPSRANDLSFPLSPTIWRCATAFLPDLIHVIPGYIMSRVRGLRSKRGMSIGYIGPDGAGKSTLIENGIESLERIGHICRSDYWGRSRNNSSWVIRIRNLILRMHSTTTEDAPEKQANTQQTAGEHSGTFKLLSTLAAPIYVADYWIRYMCQVRPATRSGLIILLDRSPLDITVMAGPARYYRFLAACSPSLDLVVYCSAPADVIRARKQERTVEELARQQRLYQKITSKLSVKGTCLIINTHEQNATVAAEVVSHGVQSCLAARHGSLDVALHQLMIHTLSGLPENV